MKKKTLKFLSVATAFCMTLQCFCLADIPVKAAATEEKIQLTEADLKAALQTDTQLTANPKRVAVHDPSVVPAKDADGKDIYYIFGTHMSAAKSYDLINWTPVYTGYDENCNMFGVLNEKNEVTAASFNEAFKTNAFQGKIQTSINGKETSVDFGNYNTTSWHTAQANYTVSGNLWAPDVIYNENTGKWHMYMSLNGQKQNSVIVLLAADNIEGPYVYQGPVVYSGFTDSIEALSYKNSDLELVYGTLDSLPSKYNRIDNNTWGNYWPHAIDPCVYYDEDGVLRMTYGSWSGGIYEIILDDQTGLRDYTVTYPDAGSGQNIISDKYFGKHLAGGYYVSGEASYIEYIDGRYYMFVTNGDLVADGNYQMRVFSSENPDGPYVDTNGQSAIYDAFKINFNADYGHIYTGSDNGAPGSTAGARLMTNYKWDFMDCAEVSQGHNSTIVTEDGTFVIYHTRFNDLSKLFEVRVHQLYTLGDGALVAAPCEYDPKVVDKTSYNKNELTGSYDAIWSKYDTNPHWVGGSKAEGGYLESADAMDYESPENISLADDGTVTLGNTTVGSWNLNNDDKYGTITINNSIADKHLVGTYDCIFIEQNAGGTKTTCFTGINKATGISIWGCKDMTNDAKAIALTEANVQIDIPVRTTKKLNLPTEGIDGATISWKSGNPDLLTDKGAIRKVAQDTEVLLTATISRGNSYYEKNYKVIVSNNDITKGDMSVTLPSADYTCSVANPFYKKKTNELYIRYTITLDAASKKDGLGGLFKFYKSEKEANGQQGYVSFQTAPYINYQSQTGTALEVNKPSAYTDVAGTAYTYEIAIDKKADTLKMYKDGKEISLEGKFSATGDISADDILDYITSNCDKFSWGTGNTEICQLEDVIITDTIPKTDIFETTYEIGSSISPIVYDNPLNGEDISLLELNYTVAYPEGETDEWAGLYAFYKEGTEGRVSFQTRPYLCYNEAASNWIDIKSLQPYNTGGVTYQYRYIITPDNLLLYVNDKKVLTESNGSGADYENLLDYMAYCDKLSIGVTNATSYWGSINSAVISDISMNVNMYSKVIPPYIPLKIEETPVTPPVEEPTPEIKPAPEPEIEKVTVNKVTLKSVKNVKGKKLSVKWKKVSDVTGYSIQYSTSKKFVKSKTKTVEIKKAKTTSKTIKKLKKGKKYYVRICAYKTVNGTKHYGTYSKAKNVKIRK